MAVKVACKQNAPYVSKGSGTCAAWGIVRVYILIPATPDFLGMTNWLLASFACRPST